MAQNIYDNLEFHQHFMHLPSQTHGLAGAPEWLLFRSLIPSVINASILDLGCGAGWAKQTKEFPRSAVVVYKQADLETVGLEKEKFNIVLSSLVFHYIVDLPRLLKEIFESLKPGGSLIFSVEHLLYTQATNPAWSKDATALPGDNYFEEGQQTTDWLADGVLKVHRTFGTYANAMMDAGFVFGGVKEWGMEGKEMKDAEQLADRRGRPRFLISKGMKPDS
ncbi:methyl transferase [Mollisia scopiformis]|uniref:Methyl transferase n=1 Tax=Mollisia scopiformis TaxID=149040 RepID=A0A194X4Y6_MOLSC|nr:methyl transferase [Mollisia scopiformis]KUJ15240.1 methyl transferase [Mollisia scopiformis]